MQRGGKQAPRKLPAEGRSQGESSSLEEPCHLEKSLGPRVSSAACNPVLSLLPLGTQPITSEWYSSFP